MEQNNSVNICASILEEQNTKMADTYFPVIMYFGISMALGAIGNCFVSYIYYHKFNETATHMFIIALSVCDFLTCIICIPMDLIVLQLSYTFHSDIACRLIRFVVAVAVINSAFIVFVIAVDRYTLICRPHRQNISVNNSKKILALLTIFTFILSAPAFFVYRKRKKMTKECGNIGETCSLSPYINGTVYPLVYYTTGITLCSCFFIIILILYLLIGMRLWEIYKAKKNKANQFRSISKLENQFTDSSSSEKQSSSSARLRKQSMTTARSNLIFFVITLIWIIGYIPHFIGAFWRMFVKDFEDVASDKEQVIYKFLTYSFYFSSALNPYVYGLFSQQFRSELLVLFRNIFQSCKKQSIESV